MSLITRKVLLEAVLPLHQTKRFRGKINVQKPKQPHHEKALFLAFTNPIYPSSYRNKLPADICKLRVSPYKEDTYNPFQDILARELHRWLTTSRLVGFYHVNSMTADEQFRAFALYKKENMHFKAYGKATMKKAVGGTPYEPLLNLYVSRNLVVFSPEPNAKTMLKISKKFPQLVLLAGIFEGKFVSKDELLEYSLIPDLKTAQVGLVQTLNSLGSQLAGQLTTPQNILVGNLQERIKQLDETKTT